MLKPAYKLIAVNFFVISTYIVFSSNIFACAPGDTKTEFVPCGSGGSTTNKYECVEDPPGNFYLKKVSSGQCPVLPDEGDGCTPGNTKTYVEQCGEDGTKTCTKTCTNSAGSWSTSCTTCTEHGAPTDPTDPNPGAGDPQDPDPDTSKPDSGDDCPSSCPNGCDGLGNCIWGDGGGDSGDGGGTGGNDGTNPVPTVIPTPNPINTVWQGPIDTLTILGVTGQPSSQAEVLVQNSQGNRVVLQTVSIADQFFNRYNPVTSAGIQWSTDWEGPIELSGFNLPSTATGNVTAYGLGINPNITEKNMYQVVWVGNNGYRRALTASVDSNNQISLGNADSQWEQIYLPEFLQGQNIQAYDFSYFPGPTQADIGFMLETIIVNNNSYYRFYPLDENKGIMFNAATGWYGPIVLTGQPGAGDIISFSNLILNENFYNRFMQNLWKDTSGGYFRELPFSVLEWPTVPAPTPAIPTPTVTPTIDPFDRYDVNRDGSVTLIDVIEIIKEIFK